MTNVRGANRPLSPEQFPCCVVARKKRERRQAPRERGKPKRTGKTCGAVLGLYIGALERREHLKAFPLQGSCECERDSRRKRGEKEVPEGQTRGRIRPTASVSTLQRHIARNGEEIRQAAR